MSIDDVKSQGFYVDHDFIEQDKISQLEYFFTLPQSRPGVIEFKDIDIQKSSNAVLIEIAAKVRELMRTIDSNLEFHKLWFQTTTKDTVHLFEAKASPFLPHIDTQRYTKAMLYVTNVNAENGPFTTSRQNPKNFEELRKLIHSKDSVALAYQTEKVEFNQQKVKFIPTYGEKGMLIIFDTNTPHFAGKVKSDTGFRQILRFDYWDKKYILK